MQYIQPYDQPSNPSAPFVDLNAASGTPGSVPPAAFFNGSQAELIAAIQGSGQTPSGANLAQLLKAIRLISNAYFTDTGTADAMVVNVPWITAPAAGDRVRIKKGAAGNTGVQALTLVVSQGGTPIGVRWPDGSALIEDDWPENAIGEVQFDGAVWEYTSNPGPSVFARAGEATTTLNFYVNGAIGSDSNDGLSNTAGHAFQTIEGAVDAISARYLTLGAAVINVAPGTYAGCQLKPSLIANWSLIGLPANPASVVINATALSGESAGRGFIVGKNVSATISGFTIESYYENIAVNGGGATVTNCNLTAPTVGTTQALGCYTGGSLFLYGTIGYTGTGAGLFAVTDGGTIRLAYQDAVTTESLSFILTGTCSWTACAFAADSGSMDVMSSLVTWSGSATGARFLATLNGTINTYGAGPNFFPGNVAGTWSNGGQYA